MFFPTRAFASQLERVDDFASRLSADADENLFWILKADGLEWRSMERYESMPLTSHGSSRTAVALRMIEATVFDRRQIEPIVESVRDWRREFERCQRERGRPKQPMVSGI